jgi:hypothetical protein
VCTDNVCQIDTQEKKLVGFCIIVVISLAFRFVIILFSEESRRAKNNTIKTPVPME